MINEPNQHTADATADLDVPCLIYNADTIVSQHQRLRAFLDAAYPDTKIFYAAKACYCPPVVERLINLGCGLELLSRDEHSIASELGVHGRSIVWNGCALTDDVLLGAVSRGEWLNVDSPDLFYRVDKIATDQGVVPEVGVRLNVDGEGKLGMEYRDVLDLIHSGASTRIVGLHFHESPRSLDDVDGLLEKRLRFVELAGHLEREEGLTFRYIDMGGGLLSDVPLDTQLVKIVNAIKALRSEPTLFLEPGAYFVEEAGNVLTRVMATKQIGTRKWATVDIGMNVLVPLNRARFAVRNAQDSEAPKERINIAGAFGVSADVVARDQDVAARVGAVLRVDRCGAYTESMMSCLITTPPTVYWYAEGHYQAIIRSADPDKLFLSYHGYTCSSKQARV